MTRCLSSASSSEHLRQRRRAFPPASTRTSLTGCPWRLTAAHLVLQAETRTDQRASKRRDRSSCATSSPSLSHGAQVVVCASRQTNTGLVPV